MLRCTILDNGIRVVTESIPSVRSFSIGIVADVGPKDEPDGKCGLAHLVEHLLFKGTSTRDAKEIARFMDEAGGQIGAFTGRDYTCYTATVLDDYRTYALDLLGDMFLNSIFPPDEMENEKKAILQEIAANADLPDRRADDLLKSYAWRDHYLGRPAAGKAESVQGLTREDVIYFMHTNYQPDRLILAAAGNLDHDDFTAQVHDAFWRMTGCSRPISTQRPVFHRGAAVEPLGVSQSYFALGIRFWPYTHPDRYGAHILSRLLGGGISSRLFRRIREGYGLAYHIGSEYHAYRDDGLLVIEGSTAPDCLQRVMDLTLEETRRLLTGDDPVDEEELWKVKRQLQAEHLIASENTHTRMARLAVQALYFDRLIPTEEVIAEIEKVDVAALRRMMATAIGSLHGQAAFAAVGPEGSSGCNAASIEKRLAKINQP